MISCYFTIPYDRRDVVLEAIQIRFFRRLSARGAFRPLAPGDGYFQAEIDANSKAAAAEAAAAEEVLWTWHIHMISHS